MITAMKRLTGDRAALGAEDWTTTPSDPLDLGNFLILPENRSAVLAIASLVLSGAAHHPANPLLLHGLPGTGKTHLAHTVLDAFARSTQTASARCVPVRELARPDARDDGDGFADPDLVACDLLILEDMQHLPATSADALCNLLDRRAARELAIVVTSSVGPAGLAQFPRRLTSRLASGLVVQLEPYGAASRRAILAAASTRIALAADTLDWLAEQRGGVRAALGQLKNLESRARAFPAPLDRTTAKLILAESGQPSGRGSEVHAIVERVSTAFELTPMELLGPSRLRNVVVPRQVAMYLARELSGLSLSQIGTAFHRDHSTVMHAFRQIEARSESDAELSAMVRQLRRELS